MACFDTKRTRAGLAGFLFSLLMMPVHAFEVQLNAAEQAWKRSHSTIHISLPDNTPPYSFKNQHGEFQGLAVDYLKNIQPRLGVNFQFHSPSFFQRKKQGQKLRPDIIVSSTVMTKYQPSQPYFRSNDVIVVRDNEVTIRHRQDLATAKVAMLAEAELTQTVLREQRDIQAIFVDTPLADLQAVQSNQADA
ncbi:MAG: transporter substrate-binding domain-containing protein [Gammaproteobacteria bacterium]|nr:transporter substrate-binding domain-containing protein [Gammaproteobacteria bacterium]